MIFDSLFFKKLNLIKTRYKNNNNKFLAIIKTLKPRNNI